MSRHHRVYSDRETTTISTVHGIDVTRPAEGHYRTKLRGQGVYVGIRIWYGPPLDPVTGEELDRSWRWQAQANGEFVELEDVWPVCAGNPITEQEYRSYCNRQRWAREHVPESAYAEPRRRLDLFDANNPLQF